MVMPSAACPSATHCQGTAFIDSNDVDTSPTATGATFDVCWREGPVSSALLLPITGASFEYCPNDLAQYVGHGYTIASSVSEGDFNGGTIHTETNGMGLTAPTTWCSAWKSSIGRPTRTTRAARTVQRQWYQVSVPTSHTAGRRDRP